MAFKMKGSPFQRNFGISPMKQDKMKASQTKINAETGETIVDENPGSNIRVMISFRRSPLKLS